MALFVRLANPYAPAPLDLRVCYAARPQDDRVPARTSPPHTPGTMRDLCRRAWRASHRRTERRDPRPSHANATLPLAERSGQEHGSPAQMPVARCQSRLRCRTQMSAPPGARLCFGLGQDADRRLPQGVGQGTPEFPVQRMRLARGTPRNNPKRTSRWNRAPTYGDNMTI
eukprot:scaffold4539_cov30-Tisochrysis_lutea.AAC.2